DLTLNGLTYFDFTSLEGLPNLLQILLGYNYLTTLKNTASANSVITIEKFYAPDNFLTHLESDLFFNFPYLYYLFIPNNRLYALPDHLCNGTQLKMLDFSGNLIRKINRQQFIACNYLETMY
ncbi:Relaxin receptor 2, partial [Trichoplax sp. H2]